MVRRPWEPLRVLVATAALCGCSDIRLELAIDETDVDLVDDRLSISGDFCASPAADVEYPVKIMFLVDGSGSQQFTDQNRQRAVAVEETVNALVGQSGVYFKIIVFNASISSTPAQADPAVFTNSLETLLPALANLAEADTLTDYQGALAYAYSELLRDMEMTDAVERGRTKYVVIFISDGMPDPQCTAGLGNDFDPNFPGGVSLLCEDQAFINCILEVPGAVQPPGATCDFGDSAPCDASCGSTICNFDGQACYRVEDPSSLFGGLNNTELLAGNDYNQPYQILQKVADIMDLEERFGVGDLRVHAGLVLDPFADPAIIDIFGDASQAAPLVRQVAEIGDGEYMEFYSGDRISFLQLNFDAIKQQRVLRSIIADNRAAVLSEQGLVPDTDFDGMPDDAEVEQGTDPYRRDADGDGYGDLVEVRLRAFGFDAGDPCLPPIIDVPGVPAATVCDAAAPMSCNFDPAPGGRRYVDSDRDGLHDCEERQLGTDAFNPDTDGDGVTDDRELRAGLDATTWDVDHDDDHDAVANGREVEWHLSPTVVQSEVQSRHRYRYERTFTGNALDGRPCYHFQVNGVRLVPTRRTSDLGPDAGAGYNDVTVHIVENIGGDLAGVPLVRTACLRTRYVPPAFKAPRSGEVVLTEDDFRYLESRDPVISSLPSADRAQLLFDPETGCVELP